MNRINYRNVILKQMVIPKLRSEIERLGNNVKYVYPKENEAKFPLIVCNINDSPSAYDIGQTELTSTITVTLSVLDKYQSDTMDLEFDATNCMLGMGFTRSTPTTPYHNEIYDAFEIDIRYRIKYNYLTESLERTIR